MANVKYVTLIEINEAQVGIMWAKDHYWARLVANGTPFQATGKSVVEVLENLVLTVKNEDRSASRNPGKRYRTAVSLRSDGGGHGVR